MENEKKPTQEEIIKATSEIIKMLLLDLVDTGEVLANILESWERNYNGQIIEYNLSKLFEFANEGVKSKPIAFIVGCIPPTLDEIISDPGRGAEITKRVLEKLEGENSGLRRILEYSCKTTITLPAPAAWGSFLDRITPSKLQRILPDREIFPEEVEALTIRGKGSRQRAAAILARLNAEDFVKILCRAEPKPAFPTGEAQPVPKYVVTKDLLSKAVFGEPGKDGKLFDLIKSKAEPAEIPIYEDRRGKKSQEVVVYTRLEPDSDKLKACGITMSRHLSRCAREIYGGLLSMYLSGNRVLSIGELGALIFNVKSNKLTDNQKSYIINGLTEVFTTTIHIDATRASDGKTALTTARGIELRKAYGLIFPGEMNTIVQNGNECTGIILYNKPLLYRLQIEKMEKPGILTVPASLLAIPGRIDESTVLIRAYLLRRIDAMNHTRKLRRDILISSILTEIGVDEKASTYRRRTIEKAERILDYWTAKAFIKGYQKIDKVGKNINENRGLYKFRILIKKPAAPI